MTCRERAAAFWWQRLAVDSDIRGATGALRLMDIEFEGLDRESALDRTGFMFMKPDKGRGYQFITKLTAFSLEQKAYPCRRDGVFCSRQYQGSRQEGIEGCSNTRYLRGTRARQLLPAPAPAGGQTPRGRAWWIQQRNSKQPKGNDSRRPAYTHLSPLVCVGQPVAHDNTMYTISFGEKRKRMPGGEGAWTSRDG